MFSLVTNARRNTLYHSSGISCVMQPGHKVKTGVTPRGTPVSNEDALAMILKNGLNPSQWQSRHEAAELKAALTTGSVTMTTEYVHIDNLWSSGVRRQMNAVIERLTQRYADGESDEIAF